MPQGKGTYGNKVGRPSKKNKKVNINKISKDDMNAINKMSKVEMAIAVDKDFRKGISDITFNVYQSQATDKKYEKYNPEKNKLPLTPQATSKLKKAYKDIPEMVGDNRDKLNTILDKYDSKALSKLANEKIPNISSSARQILWRRNALKYYEEISLKDSEKIKPTKLTRPGYAGGGKSKRR